MPEEKQDIVKILEWFFGVVFILYGLFSFTLSIIGALFLLAGGIFILPPFRQFMDKKYNIKWYGWLKWIILIILVGLGYSFVK